MKKTAIIICACLAFMTMTSPAWANTGPELDSALPNPLNMMVGTALSYSLADHYSDPDGDELAFAVVDIIRNPISGKTCGASDCLADLDLSADGIISGLTNDNTDEGDYALVYTVSDPSGSNTQILDILPLWVALSGEIQISPSSHIFEQTEVGNEDIHTFTVTNSSSQGPLVLRDFTLNNPVHYSISNNACTDQTLDPGEACTLDITFRPQQGGTHITGLVVRSSDVTDDGDYQEAVTLQGSATSLEPDIVLNRNTYNFGAVEVGSASNPYTFIIFNRGNSSLSLTSLSLTGSNPDQFRVDSNTCGGSAIPASGSCSVSISFRPTSAGSKSARLTIDSNDPDSPTYTVVLSGDGEGDITTTDPNIGISPSNLDFGEIPAGSASSFLTVTVTNAGEDTLDIGAVSISGADADSFVIGQNTADNAGLSENEMATVTVAFSPLRIGSHFASLRIPSDDPDTPTATISLTGEGGATTKLYFPHIAAIEGWNTEISLINMQTSQSVSGRLMAYGNDGTLVQQMDGIAIAAAGRREMDIESSFNQADQIGYIVFETLDSGLIGYNKFDTRSAQRVAVPATAEIGTGDLYISHIASSDEWWTGVSLVNTTSASKILTLSFSNGESRSKSIPAGGHEAFTIASLFDGNPQPEINSAVIRNAAGIIGLELFGSHPGGGNEYLSGILLKQDSATDLYYPHIANDDEWWTGVVMYNPSSLEAEMSLTAYNAAGTELGSEVLFLEGKGHKSDVVGDLGLPAGTAWFHISADQALTGFELFGKNSGTQMAGYTSVGIQRRTGAFAKLEREGWTGIAFVNTTPSSAIITLTARNDAGTVIAEEVIDLLPYEKTVDLAEDLFSVSIAGSTYIRFESDQDVVGFQLNGSENDMMLDALPGM